MIPFKEYLTEADASYDAEKRKLAKQAFQQIKYILKSKDNRATRAFEHEGSVFVAPFFNDKKKEKKFGRIAIRLGNKELFTNKEGSLQKASGKEFDFFINIWSLKKNEINQPSKWAKGFLAMEETFIHEYIHYLDSLRFKTDFFKNPTGDIGKKIDDKTVDSDVLLKNMSIYFNDPREMNANFQAAISAYEYADRSNIVDTHMKWLKQDIYRSSWFRFLTDKNKKKIKQRMYQTALHFVEMYNKKRGY